MTALWTRIHAQLSLPPSELTYEMVREAVAQKVCATDDLRWIPSMPSPGSEDGHDFGTAVAALANAEGGIVVVGVTDVDGAAEKIIPVPVDLAPQRELRALAASCVRPLVDGMVIAPLAAGTGEGGVLVVAVPGSVDAPHVVGELSALGAPYFAGADLRWMSEHQLAQAYRNRFRAAADQRDAIAELTARADALIEPAERTWLVVTAVPARNGKAASPPLPRAEVAAVLEAGLKLGHEAYPIRGDRFDVLRLLSSDAIRNPRTGLRCWVVRSNHYAEPLERDDLVHVELHQDGSVLMAVAVDKLVLREEQAAVGRRVPVKAVEAVVMEAVAVASAYSRNRGRTSLLRTRVEFRTAETDVALLAVDSIGYMSNFMQVVPGSRAVRRPVAVEAELDPIGEVDSLRGFAGRLAQDILHQFGVERCALLG
ncbi:hypothetical protein N8J89_20530 [Crossiella sp. CA-258035]|uniref:hypothetical protein n=1 Tax=Crossiella sp. CA-258035 TaxID=2981138 RepID=UPI0024BCD35D|nr:hypothetical protein [Crossiella sp. CA-258035]WHT23371.1 hypothetical protein N8J89_20530 [Crossiella sp. CA-258035]